jgi:hypothetical protein
MAMDSLAPNSGVMDCLSSQGKKAAMRLGVFGALTAFLIIVLTPETWPDPCRQTGRFDPLRLCVRAKHDAALMPEVQRVFKENFRIYGVCKIWRQMKREGHRIARFTVARLMQNMDLQGVVRGKLSELRSATRLRPARSMASIGGSEWPRGPQSRKGAILVLT